MRIYSASAPVLDSAPNRHGTREKSGNPMKLLFGVMLAVCLSAFAEPPWGTFREVGDTDVDMGVPTEKIDSANPRDHLFNFSLRLQHLKRLKTATSENNLSADIFNEIQKAYNDVGRDRIESALPTSLFWVRARDRADFTQEPKFEQINPDESRGRPLVYVNGLGTSREQARAEASALASKLKRPVHLFFLPSTGPLLDYANGTLRRMKPFTTLHLDTAKKRHYGKRGSVHNNVLENKNIRAVAASYDKLTKQLATYFIRAKEPISIISHSTGSVLVRNSLLLSNYFHYQRHSLSWVTTGAPLLEEEIYPEPKQFRALMNKSDEIGQMTRDLGFDAKVLRSESALTAHDFIQSYLPQISASDIYANDYVVDKEAEYREDQFEGTWDINHVSWCAVTFRKDGRARIVNEAGRVTSGQLIFHAAGRVLVLNSNPGPGWNALGAVIDEGDLRWSNDTRWERTNQAR